MSFTMVSAMVLRVILARENARRDKDALACATPPVPTAPSVLVSPASEKASSVVESTEKPESTSYEGRPIAGNKDLTDREDKSFRYTL